MLQRFSPCTPPATPDAAGIFSDEPRAMLLPSSDTRTDKHGLACIKWRSGKRANYCRKRRDSSAQTDKLTAFFERRQVKTATQTRKTATGNAPGAIDGDFHHNNTHHNISANNGHNIVHASNSFLRSGGTLQSKFIAIKFNLYADSAHNTHMITKFRQAVFSEKNAPLSINTQAKAKSIPANLSANKIHYFDARS